MARSKKLKNKAVKKAIAAVAMAFAIVFFWRGAWGLLDHYFFPNDRALSLWGSFILGIIIIALLKYTHNDNHGLF